MTITTRVDLIDRDVALIISEELSPAAASAAFATMARQILDQVDADETSALGRLPTNVTYVDGVAGAALELVRPDGRIVREYSQATAMIDTLRTMLHDLSPVGKTGRYRDSHMLFADGVEIPIGKMVPPADQYVLTSALPYARRLDQLRQTYARTLRAAGRRFGNTAKITLGYQAVFGGSTVAYVPRPRKLRLITHGPRAGKVTNRDKRGRLATGEGDHAAAARERDLRMPALIIKMR